MSDLIGEVDHLGFEGGVKVGAWVGIDTQANFVGQVEAVEFGVFDFKLFDDAEALSTATEAAGILHELIECFFHCVTEGGVTEVSGEGDSLGQVFIQAEGAGKGAGKGGDFDGMGETSPDMIPGSVEGELGFVLEGAKGVTMDDAFPVALEFGSKIVGGFGVFSAEALFAFRGVAIEKSGLFFLPVYTSTDRHLFGMDGCGRESRDGENPSTRNVNIGWM